MITDIIASVSDWLKKTCFGRARRKKGGVEDGRKIRTVPVSLRCAAYEYLTPFLAYIQSTMLPGALQVHRSAFTFVIQCSNERGIRTCTMLSTVFRPLHSKYIRDSIRGSWEGSIPGTTSHSTSSQPLRPQMQPQAGPPHPEGCACTSVSTVPRLSVPPQPTHNQINIVS